MKKEDYSFLMQILNSMKESFQKMKKSYENSNYDDFEKYKNSLIEMNKNLERNYEQRI
jgi:DNA-binding protein YbaB